MTIVEEFHPACGLRQSIARPGNGQGRGHANGGAGAARVGDLLHGLVREGGVVLGDEADRTAAPQAEGDAEEGLERRRADVTCDV